MFKLSITILIIAGVATAGTTVSIGSNPLIYGQQPDCVQFCILDEGFPQGLGYALQCDYPVLNECYCATASAAAATAFLSSCINAGCSSGDASYEITSAISIYDNYCLTAGYTLPGAAAVATTPATMITSAIPKQGSNTFVGGATQTGGSSASSSTSTSSGSGGDNLSRPAELATILSAIFGTILAVIAICVAIHYGNKQR
jgi:hypothetical protein